MKKTILIATIFSVFIVPHIHGQPAPIQPPLQPPGNTFSDRVRRIQQAAQPSDGSALTQFSLDFPGGTPKQLAAAIEKAMDKPINVIVPDEFADTKLPPIKVTSVTVPQLFQTLLEGSHKYANRPGFNEVQSSYGFKSISGAPTDTTIWTFYVYNNQDAGGLTKFSIDFPGGTPKQLVAAIQKATSSPLNVIVPEEFADTKLPPLKMNDVNVSELFHALELASYKTESYRYGPGLNSYQQKSTGYGFKMDGKLSDDSIWYFHVEKVAPPPTNPPEKVCKFYALAPFIDRGLKVDDITTAVETGWKMAGETKPPTISFHKDTKLLIAVGEPEKLQIIDNILQALKPEAPKLPVPVPPTEKKSAEVKTPE